MATQRSFWLTKIQLSVMIFGSVSVPISWLFTFTMFRHLFSIVSKQQQCLKCESSHFQPGEALEGAFSVIMKTDGSFAALVISEPMHSGRRCPARPNGDIRPEAILSTSFGSLRTAIHRQVTCTCQIWISGWILPHFDVRTISVASKLKKLQIFLYY